jgi:peptide-methionine (S)-S-oxide reductase
MRTPKTIAVLSVLLTLFTACKNEAGHKSKFMETKNSNSIITSATETATFGQGCFWCAEAIFTTLDGVISSASGYSGGAADKPTYKEVCAGTTGHAEVIQVQYDPAKISYEELLKAFWSSHDPTTLNRQGNDLGTQYRSVIFYHNEKQRELAEAYKAKLDSAQVFAKPIVTQIVPFVKFYAAEDYHQEYYANNKEASYCQFVIHPKLEKFKKVFGEKMKK